MSEPKYRIGEIYVGYGLDYNDCPEYDDQVTARIDGYHDGTYSVSFKRNPLSDWIMGVWMPEEGILDKGEYREISPLEKLL